MKRKALNRTLISPEMEVESTESSAQNRIKREGEKKAKAKVPEIRVLFKDNHINKMKKDGEREREKV